MQPPSLSSHQPLMSIASPMGFIVNLHHAHPMWLQYRFVNQARSGPHQALVPCAPSHTIIGDSCDAGTVCYGAQFDARGCSQLPTIAQPSAGAGHHSGTLNAREPPSCHSSVCMVTPYHASSAPRLAVPANKSGRSQVAIHGWRSFSLMFAHRL